MAVSKQTAHYGYASYLWAADLLRWSYEAAPMVQRDRIVGLLLGYNTAAVRDFEERTGTLEPSSEQGGC